VRIAIQLVILGRAALAAGLGFMIGVEREFRGKAAGDRTFALLGFGAAALVAVAAELLTPDGTSRAIQGVATGVGFLGAGLIFRRSPRDVRGLTTAASGWAVTGVAVIAGVGAYLAAIGGALFIVLVLEIDRIPLFSRLPQHHPSDDGSASPES
jgi:putative Mg2+ transporter-C (MgtC) family protein